MHVVAADFFVADDQLAIVADRRESFGEQEPARFVALVGDAELDEGNVWEAIADPATKGLGNFTMVVDLNRQSAVGIAEGAGNRTARNQERIGAITEGDITRNDAGFDL